MSIILLAAKFEKLPAPKDEVDDLKADSAPDEGVDAPNRGLAGWLFDGCRPPPLPKTDAEGFADVDPKEALDLEAKPPKPAAPLPLLPDGVKALKAFAGLDAEASVGLLANGDADDEPNGDAEPKAEVDPNADGDACPKDDCPKAGLEV